MFILFLISQGLVLRPYSITSTCYIQHRHPDKSCKCVKKQKDLWKLKLLKTRPFCLLSLIPWGGYESYYVNHLGQKYQPSLYHGMVLTTKYLKLETPLCCVKVPWRLIVSWDAMQYTPKLWDCFLASCSRSPQFRSTVIFQK